jgi:threonine dehydratase
MSGLNVPSLMMSTSKTYDLNINAAADVLKSVVLKTPLQYHRKLSEKFNAEIYLKRKTYR